MTEEIASAAPAHPAPIGSRIDPTHGIASPSRRTWLFASGLAPEAVPMSMFLAAGMACGPQGLQLVSTRLITALDPMQSVALVAMGMLIGVGLPGKWTIRRQRFAGLFIVGLLGSAAVAALIALDRAPIAAPFGLLIGVCALAASTGGLTHGSAGGHFVTEEQPTAVVDITTIVFGATLLAIVRLDNADVLTRLGQTVVIPLVATAAGVLLIVSTSVEAEQRVFIVGLTLLLAGAADALAMPIVACGFTAGCALRHVGTNPRDAMTRALTYLRRPIVLWLLFVAGARVESLLWTAAAALAVAAAQLVRLLLARPAATQAMRSAGLVGIAIGLDALQRPDIAGLSGPGFAVIVGCAIGADLSVVAGIRERAR